MEEKRINEIEKKANALLRDNRLKKAVELMGEEIDALNSWELRSRHAELQTAYNYMLEYMGMGMPDPDRSRLHRELIGKAYILNEEISAARMAEHSMSVYSQMKRKFRNDASIEKFHTTLRDLSMNMAMMRIMTDAENTETSAELTRKHEHESCDFFMFLWSQGAWSGQQKSEAQKFLDDIEVDANDKAMMVSAVSMALLKIFDPMKALLLCNAAMNEDSAIAQRALVGLAINLFINGYRIGYYPELENRIEMMCDTPGFEQRLLTVQIQLLRSRETQKIDRKMREEIIPAMLKNPNIKNVKLGLDPEKEIEQEDKNPEWEAWLEDDGIKNKLNEMAQWQTEGADVYMSTFSQLKHYPFFNDMPNWLRPFEPESTYIASIIPSNIDGSKLNMLKTLFSSKFFCNSDKYSFCFTFRQIPEEQRSALMQQLGEQHGQLPDSEYSAIPRKIEEELLSNQYIQDLYRFFKLSHFKKEFTDPFSLSLNLTEAEGCCNLIRTTQSLLRIFRYLISKEYYAEATKIGEKIEERGEEISAQFYQEMGYCMQKEGGYENAIEYYHKADLIKPDTLWTIRHIAQCHRMNRNISEALPYYMQAEELAPENRSLLLQTGECLVALKRYDEAFSRFFKVEYLEPNSIRSWRAIAWCSFMVGKYEQARNYYSKLLDAPTRNMQDWLNAGHVELVTGDNGKAIECYKKAAILCKDGDEFASALFGDKKELLSKGVSLHDLILIRDIVS